MTWPENWPIAAQATLAAAIISAIVSAFGYTLKLIFDKRKKDLETYLKGLEASQKYTFKYYSPIANRSRHCAGALQTALNSGEEIDIKYAFFRISDFFVIMFNWMEEIGGVIRLHEFIAESIVIESYRRATNNLPFNRFHISIIEKHIKPKEKFVDFLSSLDKIQELKDSYDVFQKWLKKEKAKVEETIKNLDFHGAYIMYQLNRMYDIWYRKRRIPPLEPEYQKYAEEIRNSLPEYLRDQ